jgi:hypothetical protein
MDKENNIDSQPIAFMPTERRNTGEWRELIECLVKVQSQQHQGKRQRIPHWLVLSGAILAVLGTLGTIGIAMPWQTATKSELADYDKENQKSHIEIREEIKNVAVETSATLGKIDGKIDILLKKTRNRDER